MRHFEQSWKPKEPIKERAIGSASNEFVRAANGPPAMPDLQRPGGCLAFERNHERDVLHLPGLEMLLMSGLERSSVHVPATPISIIGDQSCAFPRRVLITWSIAVAVPVTDSGLPSGAVPARVNFAVG
jgi:hypothetical protein